MSNQGSLEIGFQPHGQCFLWEPSVLWLNVLSDLLITLAYYVISASLFYFLLKRTDMPFRWMFSLFGFFIFACGTTHAMHIWTVWNPAYWMEGWIKAGTAILSFSTGLLLIPLLPKAMALRSPSELEEANAHLTKALAERHQAIDILTRQGQQLRRMTSELTMTEERERRRLAMELHDHLQQLLVLGKLKLGQGKRFAESLCAQAIAETETILSDALVYTRTLVAELSPPALRDHGLLGGLKWLGEYMKQHELAVTFHLPEKAHLRLPEDQSALLFQSIRELLINVSKYAGTAEAAVTLEQLNGELRITVTDQGRGFEVGTHEAECAKREGAYKFGLISIRERMRALGGSFQIHSTPGQGTTAILTLPLSGAPPAAIPSVSTVNGHSTGKPLESDPASSSTSSIRVLLVDDHAIMRQGLRAILDSYTDLQVVGEVGDGEQAISAVAQLRPSVIVMDINMPNKNGIEATAKIKARWPESVVIGLSVNADKEAYEQMIHAGATTLLTKEAAVESLYRTIKETCSCYRC